MTTCAKIAVAGVPLDGVFDYYVPEAMQLQEGDLVRVPFGRQKLPGVVWGFGVPEVAKNRIKPIAETCDAPPMQAEMRQFLRFMAAYSLQPLGMVLKLALSPEEVLRPLKRGGAHVPKISHQLPEMGLEVALNPEQAIAAEEIAKALAAESFQTMLLDGVTGSGKTEVYFDAIARSLAAGRQALVMLPEIALSTQWMARWQARFGHEPAVWHSDVGVAAKRRIWRGVASGDVRLVVGARSALFLPFADLGLLVVDEEHDASFKQEEGVIYHARDMAIARAREEKAVIVLASATPSLESLTHATQGKYQHLALRERFGAASLPSVTMVDMRKTPPPRGDWLSPPLKRAMDARLAAGEQVLLFLNRRGYAPMSLCRGCGHRMECPSCSAWLVLHKGKHGEWLQCHHCGHKTAMPSHCPACAAEGTMVPCGPGVERLEEEVDRSYPTIRRASMTSDHIDHPAQAAELIRQLEAGEVQLLIGTQMAAKGFHFPKLTLVGVVDADMSVMGADPRAGEKTFQLLHQVGGRAGRAEKAGEVWLQSHQPEHPVFAALEKHDRTRFYALEADMRKMAGMPPFGHMAAIILSGSDEARLLGVARHMAARARFSHGTLLGPAPAPIYRLRGQYRMRFLLKTPPEHRPQAMLRQWLAECPPPSDVQLKVDIDPVSFA